MTWLSEQVECRIFGGPRKAVKQRPKEIRKEDGAENRRKGRKDFSGGSKGEELFALFYCLFFTCNFVLFK